MLENNNLQNKYTILFLNKKINDVFFEKLFLLITILTIKS